MKKRNMFVTAAIVCVMVVTSAVPAFASVPKKEKVEYEGKGKVEVEFYGHVKYRSLKVTVKDTSGKKYKAKVVHRDNDEIKFKILNRKAGKTYKFTIRYVKKTGTFKYGKVYGTVKIPKAGKYISRAKAKSIALADAASRYRIVKSSVRDYECEREYGVYEIDFEARKSGGYYRDYEYYIDAKSGRIKHCEQDD